MIYRSKLRAVSVLSILGSALCAFIVAITPHDVQSPGLWSLWWITALAGVVVCFVAGSDRWHLLGFAVAVAFCPMSLGDGFLARPLLVVAAGRLVAAWPYRHEHVALEASALWPYLALALWREGLAGPMSIDALTLGLVMAMALVAFANVRVAPRRERTRAGWLFVSVAVASASAAFVPPQPWSVAVVFAPIYLVLSVPIVAAVRHRPLQLAFTVAVLVAAMAL